MKFRDEMLNALMTDVDPLRRIITSIEVQGTLASQRDARLNLPNHASANLLQQLNAIYFQQGSQAAGQFAKQQRLLA